MKNDDVENETWFSRCVAIEPEPPLKEDRAKVELGSEVLIREREGWRMKNVEPIRIPTRMKRSRCSLKR